MVLEKVIDFISTHFSIDEDEISEETTFEELGADEEDMDDLVLAVEGEFEIELHEDEVLRLNEVADLIRVIENAIRLTELE
ncbi:MAG TPA: phosphopantetheine-binding protein [Clostridia bacterium]|nr:phosphopantetheine-binding protein [Clostridia bacterium]